MAGFGGLEKIQGEGFGGLSRKTIGFGGLGLTPPRLDLTTSEGLYQLAVRSGLKKEADKILAEKGEHPKKIFSGGFISDIFDALNVLQYGVVGVLTGRGFKKGVEERASFAEKEYLGKYGILGTIAGILVDIAVDPLTYIAPWTIAKKIPGVAKAGKIIKETAKASKIGQWFGIWKPKEKLRN